MDSDGRIFLTFDDGPDRRWTPQILDLLSRAQVSATFFMIGAQARQESELVRRIAAEGHGIGNHTFSHRHPWTMSAARARAEVRDGAAAITAALGHSPRLYRAPHGRNRSCMTAEAELCGEVVVDWSLSAVDWGPLGTADRIATRLRQIRPGDIVLMHDGRNRHNRPDQLLRVLPGFLDELERRRLRAAALAG